MQAFAGPTRVAFRLNPLRQPRPATLDALRAAGLDPAPVPWYADAFTLPIEMRDALLASEAYASGGLYVQNLSSMVPPLALDPQSGEKVLDLAAAPGSKTLQMAALMENTGEIAAVEIVKGRFHRLRANLETFGAANVRTFLQDGTRVGRYRPDHFDRVLLDAPCSSEGRFRVEEPESYAYWSERKVKEMQRKQHKLLQAGLDALRPGGVLVYSTCALSPEENEAVLDRALEKAAGRVALEPLPVEIPGAVAPLEAWRGKSFGHDLSAARRLLPDGAFEGFFVARLVKQ